ncbi:MAG: hypothetical protein ACK4WN_04405 [Aphanizomenon sp.]|jgi:hypothetical protein
MPQNSLHSISVGTGSQLIYFKTTNAYEGTIGTKCGISKVANSEGDEEVMPVKELLRTGRLIRINIIYENAGKKKTGSLLVARTKIGDVLSDTDGKQLVKDTYKIGTVTKGTIKRVYIKRDATFS